MVDGVDSPPAAAQFAAAAAAAADSGRTAGYYGVGTCQ